MIGYIKIFKPELKVKHLQVYESYYCGLCKSLKTRYGFLKNMTLNYDIVFISLLIDCLNNVEPSSSSFRCAYNPGKSKIRVVNNTTDYVADVNIYLMYKKLYDDYKDEKKILSLIGYILLKRAGNKASKSITNIKNVIDKNLNELYNMEILKCNNSEIVADLYGNIIKSISNEKFEKNSNLYVIASHIGYNIGKWVYLIDAYDDIELDIKKNNYNPYIYEYNYNSNDDVIKFKNSIKQKVRKQLFSILDEVVKAYELVEENKYSPLIYNIILEGILNTTNRVLEGKCNYGKKSI